MFKWSCRSSGGGGSSGRGSSSSSCRCCSSCFCSLEGSIRYLVVLKYISNEHALTKNLDKLNSLYEKNCIVPNISRGLTVVVVVVLVVVGIVDVTGPTGRFCGIQTSPFSNIVIPLCS